MNKVNQLIFLIFFVSVFFYPAISHAQTIRISEIMANNEDTLQDEDGDTPDWIELYNTGTNSVNLDGWYLTDDAGDPTKWQFPATNIPPSGYLVVFASDKDRSSAGSELHTNFRLSSAGEYVALVRADGTSIEDAFAFPALEEDTSYGYAFIGTDDAAVLVDFGAACTAHVPTGPTNALGWELPGFNDAGWISGVSGIGYEAATSGYVLYHSMIGLDLLSVMRNVNSSVYIRVPFTVSDTSQIIGLTLKMKYNDAFVAYINGVKTTASELAPEDPVWNSASSGFRSKDLALFFAEFDLEPLISELVPGENILAIHGMSARLWDSSLLFVPRIEAVIAGSIDTNSTGILDRSTPGAANAPVHYAGEVETPVCHPERGFYDAPFQAVLSNSTTGALIRYTLDGSEPTESSTPYTGPVTISQTTTFRCRAFIDGWKPSPPRTDTYIFVDDVVMHPRSTNYVGNQILIFGMDEGVRTNSYLDAEGQPVSVQDALASIPSLSVTTDHENLYDPNFGIYVNAAERWERPASFELIYPDGSEGFHINAGLRIRGGWSRHPDFPKHSFRLFFRDKYGEGKLDYPLFEDEGVKSFDKIDLRSSQNYAWSHGNPDRKVKNSFVRDIFCRDSAGAMGVAYPRSRYYHLYLNGLYWGLFMTEERPVADYGASYFGGDEDDYDAVKVVSWTEDRPRYMEVTDGNFDAYTRLFDAAMAGFTNNADYFSIQGLDSNGLPDRSNEKLLDLNNMIDYLLMIYYAGASDNGISWWGNPHNAQVNNIFAIYNRANPDGFKWFQHDCEHALDTTNDDDRTGPFNNEVFELPLFFNAQILHQHLSVNAEYRIAFADRVHKHFKNDGALVQTNCEARLDFRAAQIDRAIVANAARWGSTEFDRDTWEVAVADARAFFTGRCDVVIGYLDNDGLIPSIAPPQLSHRSGLVEPGTTVALAASEGTIYYTTNGTDPRAAGGGISGSTYSGPIPIIHPTQIKARCFNGAWSALAEGTFWTEVPLAITELMYHAPAGNPHDFIEIKNISSETVTLSGYTFNKAIDFEFEAAAKNSLAPGEYAVVVDDINAFSSTYPTSGIIIAGEFSGDFRNGGEQVDLAFRNRSLISFTYSDARNWPQAADGAGHSLVPIDSAMEGQVRGSLDYGGNWRASTYTNGSPGYADPDPGTTVLLNEIVAHTDTGHSPPFDSNDQIELYNPTASAITMNDWYLSDDLDEPLKWAIPNGTVVPAFGFASFDEDDFNPGRISGFDLDETGDQVILSAPGRAVDAIRFKGQENGVSYGRYPDGSPDWMTTLLTVGSSNQPTAQTVRISELMYHPLPPAGDEMEYIQLENVGTSTAQLYNLTGTYRIDGGVSYTFPTNTTLAVGEKLWLVSFNPAVDAALLSQFRTSYGLDPSARIYGPYMGELSDRGARVALECPQVSGDPPEICWIVIDELFYFDQAPWPEGADGTGIPLVRTGLSDWDVPTNMALINISPVDIYQLAAYDHSATDTVFEIWNKGVDTLNYGISSDDPWLSATPASGSSTGEHDTVTLSYDTAGLTAGSYTGIVEITSAEAYNSPWSVWVVLEIYDQVLNQFDWDPIGTNQVAGQPFSATITALDQYGNLMPAYSGSAVLSGNSDTIPIISIGSGSSTWNYPMATYYHDSRTQVIYLNSELDGARTINSLALNVTTIPGQMLENWTIRMRHTSLNSYSSQPAWETAWTTVYQQNTTISSTGWTVFEFNAPFEYNGIDNLMIDFSHNNSRYTRDGWCGSTSMGASRSLYYRTDSGFGNPLNWSGTGSPTPNPSLNIPNIRLITSLDSTVSISPTNTGTFVDGVWSGLLIVHDAASGVVLHADAGSHHGGDSEPFNVAENPDSDGDGMPDDWESGFFGHPSNCVAETDADHDALNNLQEYVTGMDPTNSASRFEISMSEQPDGFIINWDPVEGRFYDVRWTPDLRQGFRTLASAIPYPVNSYTDRVHSAFVAGFYGVAVRLPGIGDIDGDGIPDTWEMNYFQALEQTHPDWDFDGQSNLEEYIADTNPTNAASFFSVEALAVPTLHWTARPGRTYSVYWTDDLNQPFTRIATGLTTGSYTNSGHSDGPGFYFIQVEMQ